MPLVKTRQVYGASHWSSPAITLAEGLQKAVEDECLDGSRSIHHGAVLAIQKFFDSFVEALDGRSRPKNLLVSFSAHQVATAVMDDCYLAETEEGKELLFRRFRSLLGNLRETRELQGKERETARQLTIYLKALYRRGQAERSVRIAG